MATEYKLYYFNLHGRASPIRLILHHLNVPFEDVIHEIPDWTKLKPGVKADYLQKMPFKQLPVLEVRRASQKEPLQLAQTTAICRYLGKVHGLEADTPEEQAQCDMYAEQLQDYLLKVAPWWWTRTGVMGRKPEEEAGLFESNVKPVIKEVGEIFGAQLKKNGTGYMVGSKLTWVDIFVADFVDRLIPKENPDAFAEYPAVQEHHKKIMSSPGISKYMKERPAFAY
jgi:glutathione S-transferase